MLNGAPVYQAHIAFPRIGCWHADLLVGEAKAPTGPVTLSFGSSSWAGAVFRGGAPFGSGMLRVVGGAGGLASGAQLPPKAYQSGTVQYLLGDLLADAGERLSSAADAKTLAQSLAAWTRPAGSAGGAMVALTDHLGVSWRMQSDGTVWVGPETWPGAAGAYSLLEDHAQHGYQVLYADDPKIQPGATLAGRRISYVEIVLDEKKFRAVAWYEDGTARRFDRIKRNLRAFMRALTPIDYYAQWSGIVVSQSGDYVDFQPDDPRLAGHQNVPLYWGEPGVDFTVTTPARAKLGFLNGDPSKPHIAGWAAGTKLSAANIGAGSSGAARVGDPVKITAADINSMGLANGSGAVTAANDATSNTSAIKSGSTAVKVG